MAVKNWYTGAFVVMQINPCTVAQRDDGPVFTCIGKQNIVIEDLAPHRDSRRRVIEYSHLAFAKVGNVAIDCCAIAYFSPAVAKLSCDTW